MYLSRLILDPRSRRTQAELADPYQMHRTLMAAFPEDLPDNERMLYRVDTDRHTGVPTVLVQSQNQPDWSFIEDDSRYLLQRKPVSNPDCKRVNVHVEKGQLLAFRLRANPIVKRNGRRIGLYDEQEQLQWLQRKGADGGFRVVTVTIVVQGMQDTEKVANDDKMQIRHYAARFDGQLQVTAPERFRETLESGIGPAKAFGFGLLSVAPVR